MVVNQTDPRPDPTLPDVQKAEADWIYIESPAIVGSGLAAFGAWRRRRGAARASSC